MMEFEYRKLSEEKANEIDAYGFTDWQGKKIRINKLYSVTNKDETIVFRQTFFSHEEDIPDKYFFGYKDACYFVDIFKKIEGDSSCWRFTYTIDRIFSVEGNRRDYSETEILEMLKNILHIYSMHIGSRKETSKTFVETIFKGERV